MSGGRNIVWSSAGAASAAVALLMREPFELVTCDTASEHPDNNRFHAALSERLGVPLTLLRSSKYADTWGVWRKRQYMAGISGAPCTTELKLAPRLAYQRPDDIHFFGYTAEEVGRFKRLKETFFEQQFRAPLIEKGISKAGAKAIVQSAGLRLSAMYDLGYEHANCIPCPKATSPGYYAAIRHDFPTEWARFCDLADDLGVKPIRLAGVRIAPRDLPENVRPARKGVQPSCDFLCAIALEAAE